MFKKRTVTRFLRTESSQETFSSKMRLFNARLALSEQKAVGVLKPIMARKSSYSAKSLNQISCYQGFFKTHQSL